MGFGDAGPGWAGAPEPPTGSVARGPDPRFRSPQRFRAAEWRPVILVLIALLGFWLVGWIAGIGFAAAALLREPDAPLVLLGGLVFSVIGVAFGLWVLAMLVRALRAAPKRPG